PRRFPARLASQQPPAMVTPEQKPELIAAKSTGESGEYHQVQTQIVMERQEPRQYQNRLAFQKGPHEQGGIAKVFQEVLKHGEGRQGEAGSLPRLPTPHN